MDEEIEKVFEVATEHLGSLAGKLPSEDLLYFYARYKQAKFGPCDSEKPSFFSFQARSKWDAWNSLGRMERDQAMSEYVEKLNSVDPGWRDNPSDGQAGGWVSVSAMAKLEDEIEDEEKSVIDWIKEGNAPKVKELLKDLSDESVAKELDENGLGLLHWAADRGFVDCLQIVSELPGFDVNLPDSGGQTALHYACSNGHLKVAEILMSMKFIDVSISDGEGLKPFDVIDKTDEKMQKLLNNK